MNACLCREEEFSCFTEALRIVEVTVKAVEKIKYADLKPMIWNK